MKKKPTKTEIVAYLKEQYFSTYEGEWGDLLDEVMRYNEQGKYATVVDVRVEAENDVKE